MENKKSNLLFKTLATKNPKIKNKERVIKLSTMFWGQPKNEDFGQTEKAVEREIERKIKKKKRYKILFSLIENSSLLI